MKEIKINDKINTTKEQSGQRLDSFLSKKFSKIPRKFFQREIESEKILVNDKKVKSSYKLKLNDIIKIEAQYQKEDLQIIPEENIPYKIIFQHDDFLIIEKPAGISVHPSQSEKGGTLVNGLLQEFPQLKNIGEDKLRPGIVHRLDKNSSGLMIVALKQESFEYFKKAFQERTITKKYQALVWGKLKNKEGVIDSYIGRSKSNPTKQSSNKNPNRTSNPKRAVSEYRVLIPFSENLSPLSCRKFQARGRKKFESVAVATFFKAARQNEFFRAGSRNSQDLDGVRLFENGIKEDEETTLIEVNLKTGRKHQIRVHLHSIGNPLVGDSKYETKKVKKGNLNFDRHLLHASLLEFTYLDNKKYSFHSQPPFLNNSQNN